MSDRFIVAEISKNFENGVPCDPSRPFLHQEFEQIINYNDRRGYTLKTFQLHRHVESPGKFNETIIAVFEKTHHGRGGMA